MTKMGGNAEVHGFRPCKWDGPWTFLIKFMGGILNERFEIGRADNGAQYH